jgi:hypothetical protein
MGRVCNILHTDSLNSNYDLVWSFKFLLSTSDLSSQSQGGFVTYLAATSPTFTTGGSGAFLGYDGPPGGGINNAVLGIGFDTMGVFAVSGIDSRTNGIPYSAAKPNSVTIRGGYSAFDMLYNESLSSLNTSFTLLTNTDTYQWLRFRLGNIGQTLYIDYRQSDSDSYTNIVQLPVTLTITDSTVYSIGISLAYPLSSTTYSEQNNTVLRIKNFQLEGSTTAPDTYVFSTTSISITALEFETNTTPITGNSILAVEDEHIFLT